MSNHADPNCPFCHGKGMERERGRHYGDPATWTKCDCYDRAEAQREDEEAFARHVAAIRHSDDLMTVWRLRDDALQGGAV